MHKPKDFEALKAKWYKKLEASGFEDIEQEDGKLKKWDSYFFLVRHDEALDKAKTDYYRLAGQFLNDHKFKNKVERLIWEQHAQGIGTRDIYKLLSKTKLTARSRNTIMAVINKLSSLMLGGKKP